MKIHTVLDLSPTRLESQKLSHTQNSYIQNIITNSYKNKEHLNSHRTSIPRHFDTRCSKTMWTEFGTCSEVQSQFKKKLMLRWSVATTLVLQSGSLRTLFHKHRILRTCISHQLNAQFLYSSITFVTLYSSTCFEHRALISARYGRFQSVTIPDTVGIQFSFLLKMSTSMLEICRGIV